MHTKINSHHLVLHLKCIPKYLPVPEDGILDAPAWLSDSTAWLPDATACLLVCLLGRPPVDLLGWSPGDASPIASANIREASKRLVTVLRPDDPPEPDASATTRSFSASFAASVASALQLLISKVSKTGMKYNFWRMLHTSSNSVGCGTASPMALWMLTLHFVHGHYMTTMFSPPNPNPRLAWKNSRVIALRSFCGIAKRNEHPIPST